MMRMPSSLFGLPVTGWPNGTCERIASTLFCEPVVDRELEALLFYSTVIDFELAHQYTNGGKCQEVAGDIHRHLREFNEGFDRRVTKFTLGVFVVADVVLLENG
jgi:hypothetical protein